jgi:hypothetical protein
MKLSCPSLVLIALLAAGAALGGCQMQSPKDSSIPWAQPTSWESTLPGMQSNTH